MDLLSLSLILYMYIVSFELQYVYSIETLESFSKSLTTLEQRVEMLETNNYKRMNGLELEIRSLKAELNEQKARADSLEATLNATVDKLREISLQLPGYPIADDNEQNLAENYVPVKSMTQFLKTMLRKAFKDEKVTARKFFNATEQKVNATLENISNTISESVESIQKSLVAETAQNRKYAIQNDEKVKSLNEFVNTLQSDLNQLMVDHSSTESLVHQHTQLLEKAKTSIIEINEGSNSNKRQLQTVVEAMKQVNRRIDSYGLQIGFSVSGNTILSGSYIVQFYSVETNYGSGYSPSTGKFTCSHPGLYYFSVSLVKLRDYDNKVSSIICNIQKNSELLISTWIDPTNDDTDKGSYETSAFLTVHLTRGDQVYVKCILGKLDYCSSFSGFLIQSD